jgi:hypothetical protein
MIEIDCMTVAKERVEEEKPYLDRHLNPKAASPEAAVNVLTTD